MFNKSIINRLSSRYFDTLKVGIIVKEFMVASATKRHKRWKTCVLVLRDSLQYKFTARLYVERRRSEERRVGKEGGEGRRAGREKEREGEGAEEREEEGSGGDRAA